MLEHDWECPDRSLVLIRRQTHAAPSPDGRVCQEGKGGRVETLEKRPAPVEAACRPTRAADSARPQLIPQPAGPRGAMDAAGGWEGYSLDSCCRPHCCPHIRRHPMCLDSAGRGKCRDPGHKETKHPTVTVSLAFEERRGGKRARRGFESQRHNLHKHGRDLPYRSSTSSPVW